MPLALKKIVGSGNPGAPGRIPVRSEFDIFTFLGLAFIRPNERNCFSHHQGAGGAPLPDEDAEAAKRFGRSASETSSAAEGLSGAASCLHTAKTSDGGSMLSPGQPASVQRVPTP
jgi:hypothetical protein